MDKKNVLKKLQDDKHYYGDYGKKFLSNSDIGTLLSNPLALGSEVKSSPAILIGSYFHTALLEPDKLKDLKSLLPQREIQRSIKMNLRESYACCRVKLII